MCHIHSTFANRLRTQMCSGSCLHLLAVAVLIDAVFAKSRYNAYIHTNSTMSESYVLSTGTIAMPLVPTTAPTYCLRSGLQISSVRYVGTTLVEQIKGSR
jgi:hypothetical protein